MNGTDLLASFRNDGSEGAFSELVRLYTNLVYSVAKRRLSNSVLAEDVTQTVFTRLASAAPKVGTDAELVAWLHRTTVHVAIDVWRSETRRRTREQHAAAMEPAHTENNVWEELSPVLDEALNHLSDADRQALLVRFFDRKTMRDLGHLLGVSEDAAKMRVSRALDRLRAQLASRGVMCTAVGLGTSLAERSIEAAPSQLVTRLHSLKLPASAGAAGIFNMLLPGSKMKLVASAASLLFVGTALVIFFRSMGTADRNAGSDRAPKQAAVMRPGATARDRLFVRRGSGTLNAAESSDSAKIKLTLHVVDAETGEGLTGAQIRAAYFGVAGIGEGRDLLTDEKGMVAIPEPSDATKDHGMNVFVASEGHVPKAVSFHGNEALAEYTLKLDRALSAGGKVVDQQGQPVAGVKIRVQGPGNRSGAKENIDFQTSAVMSDADGRWLCTYIPKDFDEIRFILTRDDYAVTRPVVPAGKFDLMNLALVIDRGFTVAGRITDREGLPVNGAQVRELNSYGDRRQSTQSDDHGNFSMSGLSNYESYQGREPEVNDSSTVTIRGLSGIGEPFVKLVVQAQGLASEARTIRLLKPHNTADFTLAPGRVFRGWIVDETGRPIPDAVVRTDSGSDGLRKFDWQTRTDAEGRFIWDSAPAEPVLFWFEADGYNWVRDVSLVADGSDHEIKLTRKIE